MLNRSSPRTNRDASQQPFASRSSWKDYVIPTAIALGAGIVACTGCNEVPRGLESKVANTPEYRVVEYQRLPTTDFTAQYVLDYQAE